VLDLPFGFEQDRVLLERGDLEIGLKSLEIVVAELVGQKVLHSALLRTGGSAKNSQQSVPIGYPIMPT
jgi:hypothetical protein